MIYTCPMHPEIRQNAPGRCPKCGMPLVEESTITPHHPIEDKGLGTLTWKSYIPLIVIIGLIVLASAVASWNEYRLGMFTIPHFVMYVMTGFFIIFAGFKLMDLEGFADGYATYDLLALKWFGYGYVYPFIELGFGLAMLAGAINPALLWTEAAVMVFSGIGVSIKLAKGEEFRCACLGTFLKVPLTNITLIEDFGMAALALMLLFFR